MNALVDECIDAVVHVCRHLRLPHIDRASDLTLSGAAMISLRGFSLLLVVAGVWGCAAQQPMRSADVALPGPDGAANALVGYEIGPEDVLEIAVWKEEGLKKEVLVRPDGGVVFPLVGEVRAAGRTTQQLQDEIAQRLAKFIADPVVSVAILKIAGNKIYVIGKVNKPGEFTPGRFVDVLQVLSMAGGLTPFAAENDIKVVRKENGADLVFPFRYAEVKNGTRLNQNIMLKGGDVVVVP